MATPKFLIVAAILVTGAHAKFVWQNDEEDGFPGMKSFRMPTPPRLPFAPFPPFQPFAPFPPFQPSVPFPPFHTFPTPPQIITPEEIRNVKPGPNQMFTGTVVKSQSSVVTGPDGKPIRKTGTSILTNTDGQVKEYHDGNAPPDLNEPIKVRW